MKSEAKEKDRYFEDRPSRAKNKNTLGHGQEPRATATAQRQTLTIGRSTHFHCNDYIVLVGISTCSGVSSDPMFLWIFSNSCPLNLLLFRSYQAEIIIIKHLIQGRNNVTRVRVDQWTQPSCHQISVNTKPIPIPPCCRCRISACHKFFQKSLSLCPTNRFLSSLFGHNGLSKNIKNMH